MRSNKLKIMALSFSAMLLVGSLTVAEAGINQRQRRQQRRIEQGVRNGELTRPEVRRLERQQVHIQRSKRRAKSDGVFTPRERARIHQKQNRASRRIYRQKHDGQKRY